MDISSLVTTSGVTPQDMNMQNITLDGNNGEADKNGTNDPVPRGSPTARMKQKKQRTSS